MTAPMHVLGVSRTLPFHSIGGMQAIAWDVFRMLAQQGHRVTVLTTAIPGRGAAFEVDGVRVEPVASAPAERYSAAWWRDSDTAALRVHAAHPVDAVLSISSAAAEMPAFRAQAPHVPFVFQAHGTSWGEFQSKWRSGRPLQWFKSLKNLYWLFKDFWIYRRFDLIVVVGETLSRQFVTWPMPVISGRRPVTLILNGVDQKRFTLSHSARQRVRDELGVPAGERLIVFVARLHPQKGAADAMAVFEKLCARQFGCSILFVGGGEDEDRLRRVASESAHRKKIYFTGAVRREVVNDYLSCGDLLIFLTRRQEVGLPLNVLEALASGLPVVLSDFLSEGLGSIDGVRFVAPADHEACADAVIECFLSTEKEPVRTSRLPQEYSLEFCAAKYEEVFYRLRKH